MVDLRPLPDDLPDYDDPRVRLLVDEWTGHGLRIRALRHWVDANQKYLMARLAIAALDRDPAPAFGVEEEHK